MKWRSLKSRVFEPIVQSRQPLRRLILSIKMFRKFFRPQPPCTLKMCHTLFLHFHKVWVPRLLADWCCRAKCFANTFRPLFIGVLSKCVKFHILWHACCHQPQCTKGSFGRTTHLFKGHTVKVDTKAKNWSSDPNSLCIFRNHLTIKETFIGLPIYGMLKSKSLKCN